MLFALASLNPNHAIFAKDYYFEPDRQNKKRTFQARFDNSDDFFTGLPSLKRKKDLKAPFSFKSLKEERIRVQIQQQEEKITVTKSSVSKLSQQLKELKLSAA